LYLSEVAKLPQVSNNCLAPILHNMRAAWAKGRPLVASAPNLRRCAVGPLISDTAVARRQILQPRTKAAVPRPGRADSLALFGGG
jgi:hypothetical protein